MHDTFANFYEDVMVNGHPSTHDDAILESGNRNAKVGRRNLFWGGSDELGATYEMERSTGKRNEAGELIMKRVTSKANAGIERQHLENTLLRQLFELKRGVKENSAAVAQALRVKAERFGNQCEGVEKALERLEKAVSECVDIMA